MATATATPTATQTRRPQRQPATAPAPSRPPSTPSPLGNAQLAAIATRSVRPPRHTVAVLQRDIGNKATAALLNPGLHVQRDIGDIRIKGLFPDRGKPEHKDEIYFDYAKHGLDSAEEAKAAEIVTRAGVDTPLVLQGFASEEGTKAGNKATIDQRIAQVSKALKAAGHIGTRTPEPLQAASEGTIDYRSQRKVRVVHPKATGDDCSKDPGVKCGKEVAAGFKRADELLTAAEGRFGGTGGDGAVKAIVKQFYKSDNLLVRLFIRGEMILLHDYIKAAAKDEHLPGAKAPGGPHHRCENKCKGCAPGFKAVTSGPNVLICPSFFDPTPDAGVAKDVAEFRAHVLLHESCHGAFDAEDRAKVNERAFPFLTTFDALKNADSLVGLIRELVTPGQTSNGPPTPDTGKITPEITEAMAFTHKWAQLAGFEANTVYRNGFKIKDDPDGWDTFGEPDRSRIIFSYKTIAKEFPPMTPPPKAPKVDDRQRLAAVHDRFDRMDTVLGRPIEAATGGGAVVWSKGPGSKVTFPANFSKLSLGDRCRAIIRALAKQTEGISPEAVEKYVRMAPLLTNSRSPGFAPL